MRKLVGAALYRLIQILLLPLAAVAGEPPMMHQPAARTTFYDRTVARSLDRVDQLVILGAGFDPRGYRLPDDTSGRVRCFEIDQPRTQAFKREMLAKAAVDTKQTIFVSADFGKEDWFARLVDAGFDLHRPSLFTWESVTMYLDREAVVSALQTIARTAPGTAVAFDYFSNEIIESRSVFMRYTRAVLNATGEPWHFGIDNTPPVRDRVAAFVESCGLVLEEQRNFGQETSDARAMAGFAVARVRQ